MYSHSLAHTYTSTHTLMEEILRESRKIPSKPYPMCGERWVKVTWWRTLYVMSNSIWWIWYYLSRSDSWLECESHHWYWGYVAQVSVSRSQSVLWHWRWVLIELDACFKYIASFAFANRHGEVYTHISLTSIYQQQINWNAPMTLTYSNVISKHTFISDVDWTNVWNLIAAPWHITLLHSNVSLKYVRYCERAYVKGAGRFAVSCRHDLWI